MKREEMEELHNLLISNEYTNRMLDERITALTIKAVPVRMEEKDRLMVLAAREELVNFKAVFNERIQFLQAKQKKEEEESGKAQ